MIGIIEWWGASVIRAILEDMYFKINVRERLEACGLRCNHSFLPYRACSAHVGTTNRIIGSAASGIKTNQY